MADTKVIHIPFDKETAESLKAGDCVLLSGTVYTARDAAHKRMAETIQKGHPLPFDLTNNVIYYMGPSPAAPGRIIGSAGPTTAGRMDSYTPDLLNRGLIGMIGKGRRSEAVKQSMIQNKAVYFTAVGGAGALLCERIKECRVMAYEDLGPEAIYQLKVENFPAIVVMDCHGNDLYQTAGQRYKIDCEG